MTNIDEINKSSSSLIDILICILFFSVNYVQQIPELALITLALKMIFVVFFCAEIVIRRIDLNPVILLILVLAISVFAATLFYDSLYLPLQRYYGIIGVSMFVMIRHETIEGFYKSVLYAGEFLIILNLLSMILYPEGIYVSETNRAPYWILGQKQDFVSVYVVVLLMSFLLWKNKLMRVNILFVIVAMIISLMMVMAIGLTICIMIPLCMIVVKKFTNFYFRSIILFRLYLVLEIFVILIALVSKQFAFLFIALGNINAANETAGTGPFTKADSVYTRILMWNDAIKLILNHPFGNGIISEERFDKIMKTSSYHPHIHNTLLDMTLTGGVVALIVFIILNFYISKRLDRIKTNERDIFVFVIFAMTILMLTECLYWPFTFAVYMLAYYYTIKEEKTLSFRKIKLDGFELTSLKEGTILKLVKKKR